MDGKRLFAAGAIIGGGVFDDSKVLGELDLFMAAVVVGLVVEP